jgi:hypothetical protein
MSFLLRGPQTTNLSDESPDLKVIKFSSTSFALVSQKNPANQKVISNKCSILIERFWGTKLILKKLYDHESWRSYIHECIPVLIFVSYTLLAK